MEWHWRKEIPSLRLYAMNGINGSQYAARTYQNQTEKYVQWEYQPGAINYSKKCYAPSWKHSMNPNSANIPTVSGRNADAIQHYKTSSRCGPEHDGLSKETYPSISTQSTTTFL